MKKVKVEVLPPGICVGAVETIVERFASGFYSTYGAVGVGGKCKGSRREKGKILLRFGKGRGG